MATASFRLTVEGGQEADVLRALEAELRSARNRPGCVDCRIEQGVNGYGGLRFHSRWISERHLRAFLESELMTGLLQLLELSLDEPEVLICWGGEGAGLRSLREIRGAPGTHSDTAEAELSGCGCEGGNLSNQQCPEPISGRRNQE